METIFNSNQYNISKEDLKEKYKSFEYVDNVWLWDISLSYKSYGHYLVKAEFHVDNEKIFISKVTTDMQLIDAWHSIMKDLYEDGEDGFENQEDVIDTMLGLIDPTEKIEEMIEDLLYYNFQIRQRATGTVIDSKNTLALALETVQEYIQEDKSNNEYEKDFYEIYNFKRQEVIALPLTL